MANVTRYFIANQNPVKISVPPTATTILQTTAETAAKKSSGPFDVLTGIWGAVAPFIPVILALAVFGILLYFVYILLKKGDKIFHKDYDLEVYKAKVKELSRDGARISSKGFLFMCLFTIIILILGIIIHLLLFFLKMAPLTFIPHIFSLICAVLISWLLTAVFDTFFTSYPYLINKKREILGYVLSIPKISPEGTLDILIFKNRKWLGLVKDKEIFSVPLNREYRIKLYDKKTKKLGEKIIKFSLERNRRYEILGSGDILINCIDTFGTRFFRYPIYGDRDGDIHNLQELSFVRETGLADSLNRYDLANVFREDTIVIAGSNPYKRVQPDNNRGSENE